MKQSIFTVTVHKEDVFESDELKEVVDSSILEPTTQQSVMKRKVHEEKVVSANFAHTTHQQKDATELFLEEISNRFVDTNKMVLNKSWKTKFN